MSYFLGATIPDNKNIITALEQIYGVGINESKVICKNNGLTEHIRTFELKENQIHTLSEFVEHSGAIIQSDLLRLVLISKKRLITLRVYRGVRSTQGFPVRGQRTHTNAKTARKKLNKK